MRYTQLRTALETLFHLGGELRPVSVAWDKIRTLDGGVIWFAQSAGIRTNRRCGAATLLSNVAAATAAAAAVAAAACDRWN